VEIRKLAIILHNYESKILVLKQFFERSGLPASKCSITSLNYFNFNTNPGFNSVL
jgi:hypothetical protein